MKIDFNKIIINPYILFAPFLIGYIIFVLIFPTNGDSADEGRYLSFTRNLIQGYYSPPAPNVNLANGPGYPIILIPFIALRLPLICITLMNAVFYYLSNIILFKSMQKILSLRITLIFSLLWASYYIAFQNLCFIHTETITYLLITLLVYSLLRAFQPGKSLVIIKYIIFSGFFIGYIALVKFSFGYVLLFMLAGSGLLWILNRKEINYRKGAIIMLIAFITITPYLIYTYTLTGKIFCFSTISGRSLYWMSSPYIGEYGDWKQDLSLNPIENGNYNIIGADDTLKAHHQKFFEEVSDYSNVEKDEAFKRIAIQNIKYHPLKFIENWVFNIGRLLFHYPFSYAIQRPKTLLIFPLNGILLTLMLFCLIPTLINWRNINYPIRFMLIFACLYLAENSLVSVVVRMFTPVVPILIFWIAFIIQKSIKLEIRWFSPI